MKQLTNNHKKVILDLCGGIGSWSKPYQDAGYDVRVIPLSDILLYAPPCNVYGVLASIPYNEFTTAKNFRGKGNYTYDFRGGLEICSACCRIILTANSTFWVMQNPANGLLKKWLGKPDYIFEPWQFGDNFKKATALWGNFNIPASKVNDEPKGVRRFSKLHSYEIYPELIGKYTTQERRTVTPFGFAQAFFEMNP